MNTVQVSENNVTVLVNPKWHGSFYSTADQTNAEATFASGSVSVNTTTEIPGVDRNSVIPSEPLTIRENRNK